MLFSFSSVTTKSMIILVYPFKNTGDKAYSQVSAGMTDIVISGYIYGCKGNRDLAGKCFREAYNIYEKAGIGYEKNQALEAAKRLGH